MELSTRVNFLTQMFEKTRSMKALKNSLTVLPQKNVKYCGTLLSSADPAATVWFLWIALHFVVGRQGLRGGGIPKLRRCAAKCAAP